MQTVMDEHALVDALRRDHVLLRVWQQLEVDECWVAGGWIRDRALGIPAPDLDLVVQGDTDDVREIVERFARKRNRAIRLLGQPPRAVFRLVGDDLKIEIWPLGDRTPEQDARRRDFTCNALLWRLPEGPLVDPTGGLRDVRARTVRAVSPDNLRRDPLRLLRGVRMVAGMDRSFLEEQTEVWIREQAENLGAVARERVGAELRQLAAAPRAARGFLLAHRCGLLDHTSPSGRPTRTAAEGDLGPLLRLLDPATHPVPEAARAAGIEGPLAWLAVSWGATSAAALSPFAWPQESAKTVVTASRTLELMLAACRASSPDRREVIAKVGHAFPTSLSLACAIDTDEGGEPSPWRRWWRQWRRSGTEIMFTRPPLSADEIARELNLGPGPELGEAIRSLSRATIRREIRSVSGAIRWLRERSGEYAGRGGHS